jgi:hypothetical protein
MSVSRRALFNGDVPPAVLAAVLHGIGNDLIELIGGIGHGTNGTKAVSSRSGRRLMQEGPHGMGNQFVNRREQAAIHPRTDGAFQIIW